VSLVSSGISRMLRLGRAGPELWCCSARRQQTRASSVHPTASLPCSWAAARVGAPAECNDFCTIASAIGLTCLASIERRLRAAPLAICAWPLLNPRSLVRDWQLPGPGAAGRGAATTPFPWCWPRQRPPEEAGQPAPVSATSPDQVDSAQPGAGGQQHHPATCRTVGRIVTPAATRR